MELIFWNAEDGFIPIRDIEEEVRALRWPLGFGNVDEPVGELVLGFCLRHIGSLATHRLLWPHAICLAGFAVTDPARSRALIRTV